MSNIISNSKSSNMGGGVNYTPNPLIKETDKPKILNIDGPNGSGKSTIFKMVNDMLNTVSGIYPICVHFHRRDTELGDLIQRVLDGKIKMDSIALQMLYTADRVDFTNVMYKKLSETTTKLIIVDRYSTSGLVYNQLAGMELCDAQENELLVVKPIVNFILDAPTDVLIDRLKVANPIEYGDLFEGKETLDKVNQLYSNLRNRDTIHIDATRPSELVASEIFFIIKIILGGGATSCFGRF